MPLDVTVNVHILITLILVISCAHITVARDAAIVAENSVGEGKLRRLVIIGNRTQGYGATFVAQVT